MQNAKSLLAIDFCSPCLLVKIEGACIKLIVFALGGNQIIVGAALNDSALIENHNNIGVLYGGKSVGDNKYGSALHKRVHTGGNNRLCSCIYR